MAEKENETLIKNSPTEKIEETVEPTKKETLDAKEMTTKEAYFASLNAWAKQANISQNAMAMFPMYLFNSYPQLFQNQAGMNSLPPTNLHATAFVQQTAAANQRNQQIHNGAANAGPPVGGARVAPELRAGLRVLDEQAQADIINRHGGYEYVLAPFWKRAIAEIIDVLILLLLKIIATFTIMNVFDLDLGFDINKDVVNKAIDDNEYFSILDFSLEFITFSSDLLLIEMITKLLVCCYETFWTAWHNGATPGKSVMKIRIQYVEAVLPLQPPLPPQFIFQPQREPVRALLYPAETPGLRRSFVRALVKNLVMTLLFPISVIMIFFKNNRTAYDMLSKTVVVEVNPSPPLRRQR